SFHRSLQAGRGRSIGDSLTRLPANFATGHRRNPPSPPWGGEGRGEVGLPRLRQPTIAKRCPNSDREPTAGPVDCATKDAPPPPLTLSAPRGGEGNRGSPRQCGAMQLHGVPANRRTTLT